MHGKPSGALHSHKYVKTMRPAYTRARPAPAWWAGGAAASVHFLPTTTTPVLAQCSQHTKTHTHHPHAGSTCSLARQVVGPECCRDQPLPSGTTQVLPRRVISGGPINKCRVARSRERLHALRQNTLVNRDATVGVLRPARTGTASCADARPVKSSLQPRVSRCHVKR